MSYRSILMHLDESPDLEFQAEYAAHLAQAFDARLVGLSCHHLAMPAPGEHTADFMAGDPLTVTMREAEDAAVERESTFLRWGRQAGLRVCESVRESLPPLAALCAHALVSDLVVMTQPEAAGLRRDGERRLVEHMLQSCARPVLVLPRTRRCAPAAEVAVVAWDGSAGAARAAAAALPLLARARRVDLVRVMAPEEFPTPPPVDLARASDWLSRHGISVQVRLPPDTGGIGVGLLSDVEATGAGLLVMGAWGRSRLLEHLVGGTTRTVLDRLPVPTLFAH